MRRSHRLISGLGVGFLFAAVGLVAYAVTTDGSLVTSVIDPAVLCLPGVVLVYAGIRLPRTAIERDCYPRIFAWIVGGVAVMAVVLGARVLHPGVDVQFALGTQAVSLATGSMAGLGIGVHEARAITHWRRLEAQNEALKRTRAVERQNEALKRTEERLEEAVSTLESSNERLEEFAYAASHDLQEPLRMIRSYLQLVETRYGADLGEDGREFVTYAVDGAERMSAMIDGLLAYARVDTQGEPFERVSLDDVLDETLADLGLKIEDADAEITREPLPTVVGDAGQLRQVFQNLLSNAIDYSGDEPPRIHVSAARDDASWVLAVRDEGVGIEAADADRIFEIFQRLHSIDEGAGSGIGLAICKRIVERHGGHVWVDSAPREGSTFRFTLPAEGADDRRSSPNRPSGGVEVLVDE